MLNVKMEADGEDINTLLERIGLFKVREKNAFDSEKLREDANEFYKLGKLFGALALYNAALAFAPNNEVTLASLCYANRSAVYLKLEYYKHCLHNIDLAEQHYPREKIEKLNERREKCVEMMKESNDKARQPFNHTYQLSYAPNPKIPSVIDALQLKMDETSGKYLIITKRDLKAGDVIARFDYLWTVPINDFSVDYLLACYNCLNVNNGDLIPGKCKGEMRYNSCYSNYLNKAKKIVFPIQRCSAAKSVLSNMNRKIPITKMCMKLKNSTSRKMASFLKNSAPISSSSIEFF